MFGSLRITRCRLTGADRELYRGQFCGACHAMHEFTGRLSSLLTNYDQTVLALVLGGLEGADAVEWRPCTAVPVRKVPVVPLSAPSRRYVAAVNLALVQAKLFDDLADEKRFGTRVVGTLRTRVGLRLLGGRLRRAEAALRALSFPFEVVAGLPARQAAVERSVAPDLALLATPSADLTATLFAFAATLTRRPEQAASLRRFGAALGRWVYVEDARVDRMPDRLRGRFNAIDACFGLVGGDAESHRHQHEQLAILEREMVELQIDLGAQGVVLWRLLDSLKQRLAAAPRPRSAEAGECDCCCAGCEAVECCGSGSGGGCASCCERGGCGCEACECCVCWGDRDGRRDRRQARQAKRGGPRLPVSGE